MSIKGKRNYSLSSLLSKSQPELIYLFPGRKAFVSLYHLFELSNRYLLLMVVCLMSVQFIAQTGRTLTYHPL